MPKKLTEVKGRYSTVAREKEAMKIKLINNFVRTKMFITEPTYFEDTDSLAKAQLLFHNAAKIFFSPVLIIANCLV